MPFQARLTYALLNKDNRQIEYGYAWPRHPRDPLDPALWGPPDAPLAHVPLNHPLINLALAEHSHDATWQTFAYPAEWYIAQIPARLADPGLHPITREEDEKFQKLLPPEFLGILQKFGNPAHREILQKRLGLTWNDPALVTTTEDFWKNPYQTLQKIPPGRPRYILQICHGTDLSVHAHALALDASRFSQET